MNDTSSAMHFDGLLAAGIITPAQHMKALTHASAYELSGKPGLVDHLVWLIRRGIADEEELLDISMALASRCTPEDAVRYEAAIDAALELVLNDAPKAGLAKLAGAGVITQDECLRALAAIDPAEMVLAGKGGLLSWMQEQGVIDATRLRAIRKAAAADPKRATALAQVNATIGIVIITKPSVPRPWLGWSVVLLLAGAVGWLVMRPAAVPDCTEGGTRRSIEQLFLGASLKHIDQMKPDQPIPTPRVASLSEVGYAGAVRVRACKATVHLDGKETPYTFTIAPRPEGKKGFVMTGANGAILAARFGNIDRDGNFGNKAEPIGRAEVERAFRAGVDAGLPNYGAVPATPGFDVNSAVRRKFGLSYDAPERTREIAEVEPVAPCRPVDGGKAYSCRLLVERNDPLMMALGREWGTLLDADFTFEREGAVGPWRTTAAFQTELAYAIVAARAKAVRQ